MGHTGWKQTLGHMFCIALRSHCLFSLAFFNNETQEVLMVNNTHETFDDNDKLNDSSADQSS